MKTKTLLSLVFLMAAGAAIGADRATPTVTPTATAAFTPWPTNTPIMAPTWAPESAGPVPEQMKKKKPTGFMSSAGLGIGLPTSKNLNSAYGMGFTADLGTGYKVT